MKTTTRYCTKSFGTGENAKSYLIKLQRFGGESGDMYVEFNFADYPDGRGQGYLAGNVRSASLQIPIKVLSLLVERIALITSNPDSSKDAFRIDEGLIY